jgi:hypothetical protein
MCGKFTQFSSWQEVHAFSQPLVVKANDELVASTPMRTANIMRLDATGAREMVPMRWGFAGHDDPNPSRPKHMHVRAETIDQHRTFVCAFATSRGILMVHTFNEGEELPNGKTKQWIVTPQRRSANRHSRDFRGMAQRAGNSADVRNGDHAAECADCSHHRPHAGDPAARDVGDMAWRDGCIVGGRKGVAADVRGPWQVDDGTAAVIWQSASDEATEAEGARRIVLGLPHER